MNFLFPTFLIGLTAIAIPIIIHLFNFRKYKKVYFTNVQFLKELKQESDSKSRLKEWLILAMRILAIASLVLAFAQPVIPGKSKANLGDKAVSIYVDNSFSMDNTNKKGTLLENAKVTAAEIVESFGASDKFQLITNDFEGRHQRFFSKEEFIEQLEEVKISPAAKQLSDVVKRQQDFLLNSNAKSKRVFLISDFQKNTFNLPKTGLDSNISISCVPIQAEEVNNVYIDSAWFENPVQQFGTYQTLHVIICNKSHKEIENGNLKLFINSQQVSLSSFNIGEEDKKEVKISFIVKNNGLNNGTLKIEDYPISFDDELYFSFNAQNIINALVINGKDSHTADNFKALMEHDSLFSYHENTETNVDYGLFAKKNIIVLNELNDLSDGLVSEIKKFVNNGGSVIVFPKLNKDFGSYNKMFQSLSLPVITAIDSVNIKTQRINFEHGLYEGVFEKADERMDLPKVFEHYQYNNTIRSNAKHILLLQNGQPFLSEYQLGNGKVYLFAVPSDESASNFIKHALFVPTIIKIGINSLKPVQLYYKTSANEVIEVLTEHEFSENPLHIVKNNPPLDIIPEHRVVNNKTTLFTQNQISLSGFYSVQEKTRAIKGLAFNYNRKESAMDFLSADNLQKQIDETRLKNVFVINPDEKNISSAIRAVNDGKNLWKLFLILALIFLLGEIIIIRLFK